MSLAYRLSSLLTTTVSFCANPTLMFLPPTNRDGDPIPPPVKLRPAPNGEPNSWVPATPSSPNSRPSVWKPRISDPSPTGGQPRISWDPNGHRDADSGRGNPRIHIGPDGQILDPNTLVPLPDPSAFPWPDPFVGIDWDAANQYAAYGVVTALGIIVIGSIVWILNGLGTGYVY